MDELDRIMAGLPPLTTPPSAAPGSSQTDPHPEGSVLQQPGSLIDGFEDLDLGSSGGAAAAPVASGGPSASHEVQAMSPAQLPACQCTSHEASNRHRRGLLSTLVGTRRQGLHPSNDTVQAVCSGPRIFVVLLGLMTRPCNFQSHVPSSASYSRSTPRCAVLMDLLRQIPAAVIAPVMRELPCAPLGHPNPAA